jgi:hypothetical protein
MKRYTKFYSALISLVFLVLQSNIALAAEDFLLRVDTNLGTSYGSSQAVPNIAKLKQMRFRIPTSNADNVTVQVVLANPLENPNSILDSKWNFGTWIYGPSLYCLNDDTCSFILIVRPNYNQQARIQIFKKADDKDYVTSDCPATYSIGKNENNDSVISYNLSITCLNIKATFASYTFSGYDIGFTDIPYQYTVPSYVINTDYYELAKQSYDKNGGKQGLSKTAPNAGSTAGGKQVCVSATSGTGYSEKFTLDEQCSDSNEWEFTYCDVHPKAELQVFKNKRWQKVKIVNGVTEGACEDVDQPYEYLQSSPLMGKYRVKHYGDKKFSTAYLNLKIERKNSI